MSKKRDKEISLIEKLSSLIQTKPAVIESDDEDYVTADKIAQNNNDSDYSADELDVSKFRRINKSLLDEDDEKYLGKGISRKELRHSSDSDTSENEKEEDITNESLDSANEESVSGDIAEEEQSGTETEMQPPKKEPNSEIKTEKKQHSGNFDKEIFIKAASDIEKGNAIRNQLYLWDFLLDCRMKFQKCLLASNQLPCYKNFPKFKSRDPLFVESVQQCKKSLKYLLHTLLSLQKALLNSNDDYLNSIRNKIKVDNESLFDLSIDNINGSLTKLKKLSEFSTEIQKRYEDFINYRNNTIQKWNDKTRVGYISNKNFSAFEQSTLKQIEHVLIDKQRLIKRTQTKRLNYKILGEESEEPPNKKQTLQSENNLFDISSESKNKGLNKEIFDDDDFYQQLLSEMVKRKGNDIIDPVQLGRQWMQLQKIRNKMKKNVDTKASKGRKVRFVVHSKLVNFMMPINTHNYTEESRTELFNSLFGKNKK